MKIWTEDQSRWYEKCLIFCGINLFRLFHTAMCVIAEVRYEKYEDRKAFYEYWHPRNPDQYPQEGKQ